MVIDASTRTVNQVMSVDTFYKANVPMAISAGRITTRDIVVDEWDISLV